MTKNLKTRALVMAVAAAVTAGLLTPALADPPPWAPAHGRRAKQGPKAQPVPAVLIHPRGTAISCDRPMLSANQPLISQILGAALGGAAGTQFGKGDGKLAATAAGTILGFLLGDQVGRSLSAADAACAQQALEEAETGQTVQWRNPDRNISYRMTPTRTYESGSAYCREYTTAATIGEDAKQITGTACRQPDGRWELRP
jgi:surface antigen